MREIAAAGAGVPAHALPVLPRARSDSGVHGRTGAPALGGGATQHHVYVRGGPRNQGHLRQRPRVRPGLPAAGRFPDFVQAVVQAMAPVLDGAVAVRAGLLDEREVAETVVRLGMTDFLTGGSGGVPGG